MWYLMEELANQKEREIAARTRAPLFTNRPGPEQGYLVRAARPARRPRRPVRLPALSFSKWRHWAARPDQVHCSRAASFAGSC